MRADRLVNLNGHGLELAYDYKVPTNEAEAWELIKKERTLRTLHGGYVVDGTWFHSDVISRIQQTGLLLMGNNLPANLSWKTMQGTKITMTPALALQVFTTAASQDTALFMAAENKLAEVSSMGDYSWYDYFAGWPHSYWDVV